VLIGSLMVVGIGAHYVRTAAGGEKKNPGASMAQIFRVSEGWGRDTRTPRVALWHSGVLPDAGRAEEANAELPLRTFVMRAAAEPRWKFLPPELRRAVAAHGNSVAEVMVCFSGTAGGNAAALEFYFAGTRGLAGAPYEFVIGNGRRGVDGRIEATNRWKQRSHTGKAAVSICVIGEAAGRRLTAAQEGALGELIAAIEARSGHVALSLHRPGHPEFLANAE
jgi:hypothetical protein